jgi:DNA polymerase-4
MALWQAREACPEIRFVPPHMDMYLRFSRLAREIYSEYTDKIENFGVDEGWLDVSESCRIKGDGEAIANEISRRVKSELGLTVSIGVSWNKIYAKLGSDYKKPDAITVISQENYQQIVYPLPASDLLYVGSSTKRKLKTLGIKTIGELADADPLFLEKQLGKMGLVLSVFANGQDQTPVNHESESAAIKSIGNSTTTPRDLVNNEEVKIIIYLLAESVAARLRDNGFKGKVVEISVRDKELNSFTRQAKLRLATDITEEIAEAAMKLFLENYRWRLGIRSIGVRSCNLVNAGCPDQLDLFISQEKRDKLIKANEAVDYLRSRFGFQSIQRGIMYQDRVLAALDAKSDNTVHPHSYFEHGNRTGVDKMDWR